MAAEECWACVSLIEYPEGVPVSVVTRDDDLALCKRHWNGWLMRFAMGREFAPCSAHLMDRDHG